MDYLKLVKESLNVTPSCSIKVQEKKLEFLRILEEHPIDLKKLRTLSFSGIPDEYP